MQLSSYVNFCLPGGAGSRSVNPTKYCGLLSPILGCILALGGAQVCPAQTWRSQQQVDQLRQNVTKIEVTLRLDRREYFPGEDVELTIAVKNPGPLAMEVPELFYYLTGTVDVYYHDSTRPVSDPASWGRRMNPDVPSLNAYLYGPTRWLQPAQTEEWRHRFSDSAAHTVTEPGGTRQIDSICFTCEIPEQAGEYRFCYNYAGRACADFRVLVPVLELSTEALLEKPGQYQPKNPNRTPEPMRTFARYVRTAVLGYQGTHIVVVTIPARGDMAPKPDATRIMTTDTIRSLTPYQRLATSSIPITSLDAKADVAENLTIQYTDQTGGRYTIKLGPDRQPLK